MKRKSLILNMLVAMMLVGATQMSTAADKNNALDVIMTRSSVRSYTSKTVEKEKVEQMLKAAMAAPSGNNKQPWSFVVVDQRNLLDELGAMKSAARMLAKAPLAIVVCGDMNKAATASTPEYWIQDCSAATENLLLAAHALGLGAVWVGAYPSNQYVGYVQQTLSMPEHLVPLAIISIGYPDSDPKVKNKWKPENVHYNAF